MPIINESINGTFGMLPARALQDKVAENELERLSALRQQVPDLVFRSASKLVDNRGDIDPRPPVYDILGELSDPNRHEMYVLELTVEYTRPIIEGLEAWRNRLATLICANARDLELITDSYGQPQFPHVQISMVSAGFHAGCVYSTADGKPIVKPWVDALLDPNSLPSNTETVHDWIMRAHPMWR